MLTRVDSCWLVHPPNSPPHADLWASCTAVRLCSRRQRLMWVNTLRFLCVGSQCEKSAYNMTYINGNLWSRLETFKVFVLCLWLNAMTRLNFWATVDAPAFVFVLCSGCLKIGPIVFNSLIIEAKHRLSGVRVQIHQRRPSESSVSWAVIIQWWRAEPQEEEMKQISERLSRRQRIRSGVSAPSRPFCPSGASLV